MRANDLHNYDKLNSCIDSFLLQHRNAVHPLRGKLEQSFSKAEILDLPRISTQQRSLFIEVTILDCDRIFLGTKGPPICFQFWIVLTVRFIKDIMTRSTSHLKSLRATESEPPTRFTDDRSLQSVDASLSLFFLPGGTAVHPGTPGSTAV